MIRKPLLSIAAACLLLALDAPAQTGYLSTILVDGVVNVFEDQSREVFFDRSDVNGPFGGGPDGIFGVGDILTGFVRIDDKTAPDGVDLNNQVYAIFSQEITSVDDSVTGSAISFGPVTPGLGLTLTDLGVAGAAASWRRARLNLLQVYRTVPSVLEGTQTVFRPHHYLPVRPLAPLPLFLRV